MYIGESWYKYKEREKKKRVGQPLVGCDLTVELPHTGMKDENYFLSNGEKNIRNKLRPDISILPDFS